MTKISLELIENSIQRTNPLKDRELDLKGNKISLIENLGTTLDQFDSLDFTDNEIHRFDGFPHLKRLKSINFTNNKIVRIAKGLNDFIGNVTTVVLTGNSIVDLREVDNLAPLKELRFLALLKNPVASQPHYRLQVIARLPQLRILDFSRVKDSERAQAASMFGSATDSDAAAKQKGLPQAAVKAAKLSEDKITGSNADDHQMEAVDNVGVTHVPVAVIRRPTIADAQALRAAIQNTNSNEEVDRLNYLYTTGKFAGFADLGQRMFR